MPIAVIFDGVGTLLRIQGSQHPYPRLLKLGKARGCSSRTDDIDILRYRPLTLSGSTRFLGMRAASDELAVLEQVPADEVECIEPYPGERNAVCLLPNRGIRV